MLAYVVEEMANTLSDRFVVAGLDRVVPKETNAVCTVSEKIDSLREHVPWSLHKARSKRGRSP